MTDQWRGFAANNPAAGQALTIRAPTKTRASVKISSVPRALEIRAPASTSATVILTPGSPPSTPLDDIAALYPADVTDELNAYFATLPNGHTVTFPTGSDFVVNGTLIPPRRSITFTGTATFHQLTQGDRNRAFWHPTAGDGQVWRNWTLLGHNTAALTQPQTFNALYEEQDGLWISGTTNFEIDNVDISLVHGDFVAMYRAFGHDGGARASGRIHHCTFAHSGRQGISIVGVDGVEIDNNNISGTSRAIFDMETQSTAWPVDDVEIHHNTIGFHVLYFLAASGGIRSVPIRNVNIHDNTSTAPFVVDFRGDPNGRRGPISIVDNVSSGAGYSTANRSLMNFAYVDGVTVTGNTCQLRSGLNPPMVLVRCLDCTDVDVSGNSIGGLGQLRRIELTTNAPGTTGTSLTLKTGKGALLPAAPFAATVWGIAYTMPTRTANANSTCERVQVTAKTGDTLTITRHQAGSIARNILVGDQFSADILG